MIGFTGDGSVQNGWRPGVIFQNNKGNECSPNLIVLPLTSSVKKIEQPTHVLIHAERGGLLKDSIVLCENPKCISKSCLGKYITTLSDKDMCKIAEASLVATSAIAFIPQSEIMNIWENAKKLNSY